MRNKRSAKIVATVVLGMLGMISIDIFAADPSFSITPTSGTQLKLHCAYNFGIIINPGGLGYNGFDSTLKFDNTNISVAHSSTNPFFTSTTWAFVTWGNLFRSYGVRPGWSSTATLTAENFIFSTTHNILSTFLELTTRTWWTVTFNTNTTDDGAVINSSISSLDILTWVTHAGYTFVALPCIIDNEQPLLTNQNPLSNANYIATGHTISFTLYDWAWPWVTAGIAPLTTTNNRNHYRYSGLNTTLANYQSAPTSVDNQEWVHSGTIKVRIACPTCSGAWTYNYTWSNLTITPWWGDATKNRYTWDSADRWYTVSFPAPSPYGYEVEKEVSVIITWSDNANEVWTTHTGTFSFIFNTPVNPVISMITPTNGSTYINPKINPIIFSFVDVWAGINTWSIQLTVPAIYSWATLIYTGKTYSWSDFTITTSSGQPGLWNSWSYQVSFTPTRTLPNNTWITITWYVKDLANNQTTNNFQFTTRPNCAFFWCAEVFEVHILSGIFSWIFGFTWSIIQVTGTNIASHYPYLTGTNHDILMCWLPYTWTILTWNIWIYDTTGTQINGYFFTGDKLYITGTNWLNFVLSGNVIIIQ